MEIVYVGLLESVEPFERAEGMEPTMYKLALDDFESFGPEEIEIEEARQAITMAVMTTAMLPHRPTKQILFECMAEKSKVAGVYVQDGTNIEIKPFPEVREVESGQKIETEPIVFMETDGEGHEAVIP